MSSMLSRFFRGSGLLLVLASLVVAGCGGGGGGGGGGVAPRITSSPEPVVFAAFPYEYRIVATGDPQPTITVEDLPFWMDFDGVDRITGTPLDGDVGTIGPITVRASNGVAPEALQRFSFLVLTSRPPVIASAATAPARVGQTFEHVLIASGEPVPAITVQGLPPWLSFDGVDTLSGTPTAADYGLSDVIPVTASNGRAPNATQNFRVDVRAPTPVFNPYEESNQVWVKTDADSLTDMETWLTLTLEGAPAGATGVILNLRGRARGINGAARTGARLMVRAPGAAEPDHRVFRIEALSTGPSIKQQNLVFVPLGSGNTIEYWYRFDFSGAADDEARARIIVQGFVTGGLDLYTPFDASRVLLQRDETSAQTDEGTWNSLTVPGAPAGAQAVILNLHGRVAGESGGSHSAVRLWLRTPGSPDDPGKSASMRVNAVNDFPNRNKMTVMVPLGVGGTIEYNYEFDESGSASDETRVEAYVQGFLRNDWAVREPLASLEQLFSKDLSGDRSDEATWQSVHVPNRPAGATAVILALTGHAQGRSGPSAAALWLYLKRSNTSDPFKAALRINAISDDISERGKNLVIVELDPTGSFLWKYDFATTGSANDDLRLEAYVQGFVVE